MWRKHDSYRTCLCDYEHLLPKMASVIGATYTSGEFEAAKEQFVLSGGSVGTWSIAGSSGCKLTVKLEQHEGYFFVELSGTGAAFADGKQMLWDWYIAKGGNPEAQERP